MAVDPQILQFYQRLAEQFGALPPPEDAAAQRARFEAIAAGLAEPAGEPSIVSSPAPSPVAPQPAASPTASDLLTR